jgi:hypothetical protein
MRSRDAALAAKYTEDSGDDEEGAEEEDVEEDGEGATHKEEDKREDSETGADTHTHTHTHTHTQEDEETIKKKRTLERLFALDVHAPNERQRSHNSSFKPNGAHLESVTNDGDDAAVFKPNVTGITLVKPPRVDNDSRQIASGLAQVLSSLV